MARRSLLLCSFFAALLAACGGNNGVTAGQGPTSSTATSTTSSASTTSTPPSSTNRSDDPTQQQEGDEAACRAFHNEGEAHKAELKDKSPADPNLQPRAYEAKVEGLEVDASSYYATVRAALQSLPERFVPTWLPQELAVQVPKALKYEPLPHTTPLLRLPVVMWDRLPTAPALTVYVEIAEAPVSPLTHTISARVGPFDAVLLHRSDADVVAWNVSSTVSISIEMDRFDRRMNCAELLAIARSVVEYH